MPVIAHRKPYNAAQRASHTQCRRGSRDAELMHLVLQPCGTHLQLGEHAPKRPALPDPPHPQVALQIREAQLRRPGGELLVGGGAPGVGGGHPAGRRGDARLVEQVADDLGGGGGGGGKLTGQPRGTGLLLDPRVEVAGKVAVPLRVSATAQAALVAVEDREAALEGQRARRLRWWWRYTCAWRAGGYDHR